MVPCQQNNTHAHRHKLKASRSRDARKNRVFNNSRARNTTEREKLNTIALKLPYKNCSCAAVHSNSMRQVHVAQSWRKKKVKLN